MAGLQFKKIGFYHKRKYAVCSEAVESKLENILRYSVAFASASKQVCNLNYVKTERFTDTCVGTFSHVLVVIKLFQDRAIY